MFFIFNLFATFVDEVAEAASRLISASDALLSNLVESLVMPIPMNSLYIFILNLFATFLD